MRDKAIVIMAWLVAITICTVGAFTVGNWYGESRTMNAMYRVENEKLQKIIGEKMAVVNAYERKGVAKGKGVSNEP